MHLVPELSPQQEQMLRMAGKFLGPLEDRFGIDRECVKWVRENETDFIADLTVDTDGCTKNTKLVTWTKSDGHAIEKEAWTTLQSNATKNKEMVAEDYVSSIKQRNFKLIANWFWIECLRVDFSPVYFWLDIGTATH